MSWLEDAKKRCDEANCYDNAGLTHCCMTDDLPRALELLERAKSIMNQWTHSVDEDSYDDAYMRATQWIEEVEG